MFCPFHDGACSNDCALFVEQTECCAIYGIQKSLYMISRALSEDKIQTEPVAPPVRPVSPRRVVRTFGRGRDNG